MFPLRERAGEAALTKFFVDRRIHTVSVCSLTWLARLHIATHSLYVAEQELGGPGEPAGDGGPAGAVQPRTGTRSDSRGGEWRKREPIRQLRGPERKRTKPSSESN